MNNPNTIFIKSSTNWQNCPKPDKLEFAFIGRSNVGKSSLINLLVNQKNAAKISSTPGKTKTINHYLIDEKWYLVDLPGYGYAKVSKSDRKKFSEQITQYLTNRINLACAFLLIDCRHQPLNNDLEFMRWMGNSKIPFIIIFTKIDKLNNNKLNENIEIYTSELRKEWEFLPRTFFSSATSKTGRTEIMNYIEELIEELDTNKV